MERFYNLLAVGEGRPVSNGHSAMSAQCALCHPLADSRRTSLEVREVPDSDIDQII
jgi:hypothetical protein